MDSTFYETTGEVAVITLNNPLVNGLGLRLRKSIVVSLVHVMKANSKP